ncbi:MAG: hypothetical protein AAB217_08955, partial [Chloroflexota bacterium]
ELPQDGAYGVDENGNLFQSLGGQAAPLKKQDGKTTGRLKGLIGLGPVAQKVRRLNIQAGSDEELAEAQAELNTAYDAFVKAFGPVCANANTRVMTGDPNLPYLMALEDDFNAEANTARKAAIFFKRTVRQQKRAEKADSAQDALLITLNETGNINWQRMATLTGRSVADPSTGSEQALQDELAGKVYRTPAGEWQMADEYLSGNVRQKLIEAEAAAKVDPSAFALNVEALRAAQPVDLLPHEIVAPLGVGWVDREDMEAFSKHLFRRKVKMRYIPALGQWTLEADKYLKGATENTKVWGMPRVTGFELLKQAMNAQLPTIQDKVDGPDGKEKRVLNQDATLAAREMQDKIKTEFKKWLFSDAERAGRLAKKYNELYNAEVPRTYDGSHLTLPGTGDDMYTLREHQKDAIWRIMQGDNTLLAHLVGSGKSFAMIGAGMELRRMGLRQKVMHTIPNHMLEQYGADLVKMYPSANVLLLGGDELSPQKRALTMSRIATGDWDAVVVTHGALEKLPISDKTFESFVGGEIAELRGFLTDVEAEETDEGGRRGKKKSPTVKEIEKQIKRLEAKLEERRNADKKDTTITWEELGVDQLFVDEADKFKNLFFPTRRRGIPGIGGTESGRAFDLFMKTQYLMRRNGGMKGLVFSTGTPIANSVSEMYTLQRYLDYDGLKAKGLGHFDGWATMFGDTVTGIEMKPTGGGYRQMTRFARFNNVPELKKMFMKFADIQVDPEALGLPRPRLEGGKATGVSAPASPRLKKYISSLVTRAENLGHVDPREDNMLKITGDGRKAALDMRLVNPGAEDDPASKLNKAVDNIFEIYQNTTGVETPGVGGKQDMAQLVFCDLGVPKKKGEKRDDDTGFDVYNDIRKKLTRKGVKPEEIAFIQDYDSDDKKFALFQKVNAGQVRVLIGSTEMMGAGTNAQRRLAALHHLDAPWRPRDVEQREGRILRQGNLNGQVKVSRYLTEESFDVYNWQLLERKARFIAQVMNRDLAERSVDDVDSAALSYAEMKALATGNPAIIEQVAVDSELRKLESLEKSDGARRWELRRKLASLPEEIQKARAEETMNAEASAFITQAKAQADEAGKKAKAEAVEEAEYAKQLKAKADELAKAAKSDKSKTAEAAQAAEQAETAKQHAENLAKHAKEEAGFTITLKGREFNDRENAGNTLRNLENEHAGAGAETREVGAYLGFPIVVKGTSTQNETPELRIRVSPMLSIRFNGGATGLSESALGNMMKLTNALNAPEKWLAETRATLDRLEKEAAPVQAALDAPFEHAARLDGLRKRAAELTMELEAIEKDDQGHRQVFADTDEADKADEEENDEE